MMRVYVEDIFKEVDILNWYKTQALKRGEPEAVLAQTTKETRDAVIYHMRTAVMELLTMANNNRVRFTCEYKDEAMNFDISPIREGREYLIPQMKETVRLFLVEEIRRLWMMNINPQWAEETMRERLKANVMQMMNDVTAQREKIRRRCAVMGI